MQRQIGSTNSSRLVRELRKQFLKLDLNAPLDAESSANAGDDHLVQPLGHEPEAQSRERLMTSLAGWLSACSAGQPLAGTDLSEQHHRHRPAMLRRADEEPNEDGQTEFSFTRPRRQLERFSRRDGSGVLQERKSLASARVHPDNTRRARELRE